MALAARHEPIRILDLYPQVLNMYGDHGNVLALIRRLQWHGYAATVFAHHPGQTLPPNPDLIIGGGGQDSGQVLVHSDLQRHADELRQHAQDGVPMLAVCGLYQLFGHHFTTTNEITLDGIGILDIDTRSAPTRLIGNVSSATSFGTLFGFENHSGRTLLGTNAQPLGHVRTGAGNNGIDGTEGARQENIIGTYLHGPVLPNNPVLCDHLIATAVRRKFGDFTPIPIDDTRADRARAEVRNRIKWLSM